MNRAEIRRWLRLVGWGLAGGCAVTFVMVVGRMVWDQRSYLRRYDSQKRQAQELNLTYEMVLRAPLPVSKKPVLWRLGRVQGTQKWYYHGDGSRPIHFLHPPDLPSTGRKGMDLWLVLALVRGTGPQGVSLEFLRDYGSY